MRGKLLVIFVAVAMLVPFSTEAQDFFKVDGYMGIEDEANIVTFRGFKLFPHHLSLFSFMDFIAEEGNGETDFSDFYGEVNLTYEFYKTLGVVAEVDVGSNIDTLGRFGLSYRPPLLKELGLLLRFFPYRSDNGGGQLVLCFYKDISKRFFIEGWADLDLWWGDSSKSDTTHMGEIQAGVKITQDLCFVAEYRFNNYMKGFHKTDDGVGLGLEYRF